MEQNEFELLPEMKIPMEDENGVEVECEVLAIFPLEKRQYIVLAPEGREENWLYRFIPAGEEEFNLEEIEDEEEFEKAANAFDEISDQAEFDAVFHEE